MMFDYDETLMKMMYNLLPPHYRKIERVNRDGEETIRYLNEVTGEELEMHPFDFLLQTVRNDSVENDTHEEECDVNIIEKDNQNNESNRPFIHVEDNNDVFDIRNAEEGEENKSPTVITGFYDGSSPPSNSRTAKTRDLPPLSSPTQIKTNSPNKEQSVMYEYRCQWSEHDGFGRVNLNGLTIRVVSTDLSRMLVKLDGSEQDFIPIDIKGPYGSIEMYDLFIGAKLTISGKNLMVSSINGNARRWIEKQHKRLSKQQAEFRRRIESLGEVPCVQKRANGQLAVTTRPVSASGSHNLRQLVKENARLGEQLAKLGLAPTIH